MPSLPKLTGGAVLGIPPTAWLVIAGLLFAAAMVLSSLQ